MNIQTLNQFFQFNIKELKKNALKIEKISHSKNSSVYTITLEKPFLNFNIAILRKFDHSLHNISLVNEEVNFKEVKSIVRKLTNLLGTDLNDFGLITEKELEILGGNHIQRIWGFDKNQNPVKGKYPTNDGYSITLEWFGNNCQITILKIQNIPDF